MVANSAWKKSVSDRQRKDKEALLEPRRKVPIVQVACERSAISRATYYRWCTDDTIFKKATEEAMGNGIAFLNDMTESQLLSLIKEKKMPAISLWLRNRHPAYKTKKEVDSPGPVTFTIAKY
jgi:hypothetical protein